MFGKKGKSSESDDANPWGSPAPADNPPPVSGPKGDEGLAGGDAFWGGGAAPPDSPDQVPAAPPITSGRDVSAPPDMGVPANVPEMLEPVFIYICQLHRQVSEGRELQYSRIRGEIEAMLSGIKNRAGKSPTMQQQFERLEDSVDWYIDYLIGSSNHFRSLKSDWNKNRLGEDADDEDGGILTGDEAVFHELEKTLSLAPDDKLANERLTFFYNAIGTGFRGEYSKPTPDNDSALRGFMDRIYPRVRDFIDANPTGRVTPEAYNHLDKRDFVAPARDRPFMVICGILCLGMALLLGYFWLYGNQKEKLESFLEDLIHTT